VVGDEIAQARHGDVGDIDLHRAAVAREALDAPGKRVEDIERAVDVRDDAGARREGALAEGGEAVGGRVDAQQHAQAAVGDVHVRTHGCDRERSAQLRERPGGGRPAGVGEEAAADHRASDEGGVGRGLFRWCALATRE